MSLYAWLLAGYRTNSPLTNLALVGFLERLASPRRLNLEPMLYQASLGPQRSASGAAGVAPKVIPTPSHSIALQQQFRKVTDLRPASSTSG